MTILVDGFSSRALTRTSYSAETAAHFSTCVKTRRTSELGRKHGFSANTQHKFIQKHPKDSHVFH